MTETPETPAIVCSGCELDLTDFETRLERKPCPNCGSTNRKYHVSAETSMGFASQAD